MTGLGPVIQDGIVISDQTQGAGMRKNATDPCCNKRSAREARKIKNSSADSVIYAMA